MLQDCPITCIDHAEHQLQDTLVYAPEEVDQVAYYNPACCGSDEGLHACSLQALGLDILPRLMNPADAREHGIQGQVIIGLIVETNGTMTNFPVVEGIGEGCEEPVTEALMLSGPFIPAILHGYYVRSSEECVVSFGLQ